MSCFHIFYKISLLQSNKKIKIQRDGIQLTANKPTWNFIYTKQRANKMLSNSKKNAENVYFLFLFALSANERTFATRGNAHILYKYCSIYIVYLLFVYMSVMPIDNQY